MYNTVELNCNKAASFMSCSVFYDCSKSIINVFSSKRQNQIADNHNWQKKLVKRSPSA